MLCSFFFLVINDCLILLWFVLSNQSTLVCLISQELLERRSNHKQANENPDIWQVRGGQQDH